jgi:hypothetical protein
MKELIHYINELEIKKDALHFLLPKMKGANATRLNEALSDLEALIIKLEVIRSSSENQTES